MSIAEKIAQLKAARNDIRAAIEAKGIPAGSKNFSDFAGLILKLGGTIATTDLVDKLGVGDLVNKKLSDYVVVSNGETPAFALASGQILPSGVTLATDGILQGHPTDAGVFDFMVSVTAAGCASATLRVVITVVEAGVITVSNQVVTGTKGEQVSHQLVATASNGEELEFLPYVGNDCPANLTCSSSGLITGIPAEAKTTKVQFYVRAIGCPDKLFYVDFKISEASDGFPVSFTVSSVSYQGDPITAPCGTYTRTGEKFPVVTDGVAYPVYSYTGSDNKIYYICVAAYMFGGDGPAWMLTDKKPTASSVTTEFAGGSYGGATLKSGSYEPADTQWVSSSGSAVVSWEMGGGGLTGDADREATAFGNSGSVLSTSFQAVLQKYTYTGTFPVAGETFPYFTGNGSTPWYLFGGKVNEGHYALYLYRFNPTTSISAWNKVATSMNENSTDRLLMLGKSGSELGTLTKEDVTGDLPATLLSAAKWWTQYDSGYDGTQVCDTIVWS